MANRIALRELQTRLATRLQAAHDQNQSVSWLAVESGASHYLFPLTQAEEIFPRASIQSVPYAHGWFVGVANLRGGLFGVIDLARFIGDADTDTEPKAAPAATEPTASSMRMVTLNAALDVNCALLIDRLAGLRSVDSFQASHEAPQGSPDYFGHRYVDADAVHWQELNLQSLVHSPRFLENRRLSLSPSRLRMYIVQFGRLFGIKKSAPGAMADDGGGTRFARARDSRFEGLRRVPTRRSVGDGADHRNPW